MPTYYMVPVLMLTLASSAHASCASSPVVRPNKLEILVTTDSCRPAVDEAALIWEERYGESAEIDRQRLIESGFPEEYASRNRQRHLDRERGVLVEARTKKSWSRVYRGPIAPFGRAQKPESNLDTRTFYLPDVLSCDEVTPRMIGKWDIPCCDIVGSTDIPCARNEFLTLRNTRPKPRVKSKKRGNKGG